MRQEFDDVQLVQLCKVVYALGLRNPVVTYDLFITHVVAYRHGNQQQLYVGDQFAFLFLQQPADALARLLNELKQIRQVHVDQRAYCFKPLEAEAPGGKHALYVCLAHAQSAGNVGVGEAGCLERLFQGVDDRLNLCHEMTSPALSISIKNKY